MKLVYSIALILIGSLVLQLLAPWWSFVIVAIVVGAWLPESEGKAFLAGFLGVALLWGVYAAWINNANEGLLAGKMGQLLGGVPGAALPLVSAILGGLLGGLGAWTGKLGLKALR